VARNSLSRSRTHGIATSLGTALGVAIFAVLASFGVTALIEQAPTAFLTIKVLGGLYLLYLAWRIWGAAAQPLVAEGGSTQSQVSFFSCFLMGLVTQLSNPKTALVIAGIFAAFVPANPPVNTAVLVAIIAFVIDFAWYAVVALTLSSVRTQGVYRRAKKDFDRAASIFLGAVGVKLILD